MTKFKCGEGGVQCSPHLSDDFDFFEYMLEMIDVELSEMQKQCAACGGIFLTRVG
jgi:hypothetical protein